MTNLIIQGPKTETEKVVDVLKNTFHTVNKKTSYVTSETGNVTCIVEVHEDEAYVENFSADEIMKALACCSNSIRDCATCPYKKINSCMQRLQIDSAVLITRVKSGELKL